MLHLGLSLRYWLVNLIKFNLSSHSSTLLGSDTALSLPVIGLKLQKAIQYYFFALRESKCEYLYYLCQQQSGEPQTSESNLT